MSKVGAAAQAGVLPNTPVPAMSTPSAEPIPKTVFGRVYMMFEILRSAGGITRSGIGREIIENKSGGHRPSRLRTLPVGAVGPAVIIIAGGEVFAGLSVKLSPAPIEGMYKKCWN
ncbi:hypothetical protein Axi01nite_08180 [Actinoplanes xinjiangensis]|nr:hypothetical protein Axi01nite_08180 [Actinoplanes xinjiangensis]